MIPETLVQAMTAVRLVGNDAAHSDPSKIDFDVDDDESSAVAEKLFRMINIIADRFNNERERCQRFNGRFEQRNPIRNTSHGRESIKKAPAPK